jgi:hypothetical protein
MERLLVGGGSKAHFKGRRRLALAGSGRRHRFRSLHPSSG